MSELSFGVGVRMNICSVMWVEHVINENHAINWDQPQVIMCDQHTTHRKAQKALTIHTRKEHTMNRDTDLELSKLWLNIVTKQQ